MYLNESEEALARGGHGNSHVCILVQCEITGSRLIDPWQKSKSGPGKLGGPRGLLLGRVL